MVADSRVWIADVAGGQQASTASDQTSPQQSTAASRNHRARLPRPQRHRSSTVPEYVADAVPGQTESARSGIHGSVLGPGDPVHASYVGKPSPIPPQRNPVGYFDAPEDRSMCLCACGEPTKGTNPFLRAMIRRRCTNAADNTAECGVAHPGRRPPRRLLPPRGIPRRAPHPGAPPRRNPRHHLKPAIPPSPP